MLGHVSPHVSELYYPPRLNLYARELGLRPGFSLDLLVNYPVDNKPWDLTDPVKRARAKHRVITEKPFLLVGCPPCAAYSTLFHSNRTCMDPNKYANPIRNARIHIDFVVELYNVKLSNNRYFLHEHPWGARSWKLSFIRQLASHPSVETVKGHMCMQGMTSRDKLGDAPVLKPTGWMFKF